MTAKIEKTLSNKIIFFLLCAVLVFTTLAYGTVHQPTIALFYLMTAIIVILWAVDSFQTGVFRFNKSLLQVPLILTVVYAIIQIFPFGTVAETGGLSGIPRTISIEPFWTQMFAFHFLALLSIFAVMLVYLDSAKRLRKMTLLITVFGFGFAFFAILQYVLSPTKIYGIYEAQHAAQPFGSFVNRHNFAAFMEMAIAVPLGLMFVGAVPKDKRLIYWTAIGLMGIAIILSGSRGGLVALLAALFFMVLLTSRAKGTNQIALRIGLAVLLVAVIIFGSIFVGGESSLTRFVETAVSDDITTNRSHIWDVTLQIIRNHWFFGAGIGAFAAAYTPYDTFNGIERVEQAHNDYLQILADAGIIGLILAGFFVFKLFQTGFKNYKTDNLFRRGIAVGALTGCFSILVHSIFDFVLHTTAISVMFLTLASLLVISGREFEDDEKIYEKRARRSRATVTPIETGRKKLK